MGTSSASHGDGARARAMLEMERGRETAARLRSLLMGSRPGDSAAEELVEEVLGSIATAIAALGSGDDAAAEYGGGGSVCSGDPRSEVSTGKRKGSPGIGDDRRGGRPRRSQNSPRREVMSKTEEDGQSWRKYGRKEIQNCTHPRSYYRCTHKYDQRCMATRQVQRSENDRTTFIITYMGEHTCCRNPSTIPEILEPPLSGDSNMISFEPNPDHAIEFPKSEASSKPASAFKQEWDEDVLSSLTPAASSQAECSLLADQLAAVGGGGGGDGDGSEKPFAGTAATPNDGDVTSGLDLSLDFWMDIFPCMDSPPRNQLANPLCYIST